VGLLAFAVALCGTAYAEVQNIRVSGDLDVKAVAQTNYDLKAKQLNYSHEGTGTLDNVTNDDDSRFIISTLHLQVDADLTDNVSATVRLLNQRLWEDHTAGGDQITLDNAYVVLREFLYSPLTVILGRQNLLVGNGFIVGDGALADPEGVFAANDPNNVHAAGNNGQEYSAFNAFDAVRLILDYSPLTLDLFYAKGNESGATEDDETLYGVVANYKLDEWDAVIEPYWIYLDDQAGVNTVTVNDAQFAGAGRTYEGNKVHTLGVRTSASPVENLRIDAEGAFQFGDMYDTTGVGPISERDREAFAASLYANYTWEDAPWTPATGLGWVFFSGEEASTARAGGDFDEVDEFNAWHSVYRGQFWTYIQDFLGGADAPANPYTTVDANDTGANTNRHLLYFDVNASPMEDVTLFARYVRAYFDEDPRPGRDSHAGDEFDVKATYDYTEDVTLGVFAGWFFPGDYYDGEPTTSARGDAVAWTAGGTASVDF